VGGGVALAEVGLSLDDARRPRAPTRAADEDAADQAARGLIGRP
jgi:hypothetical protein